MNKEIENSIALVLKGTPYLEDSLIVSLAFSDGVHSCYAPHVFKLKSPLKPLLFAGSIIDISYEKKEDFLLAKQATIIFDSSMLYGDSKKIAFLYYLIELSDKLFNYRSEYPLAEVRMILESMRKGADVLSLSLLLTGLFYKKLGIKMITDKCIRCSSTHNIVSYSIKDGGFLCADCSSVKFPVNALYIFKFSFMDIDEKSLIKVVPNLEGKKVLKELADHLANYFEYGPFNTLTQLINLC